MQSEVNQEENLNRIITVPNLLSFFRLCLIPVIIWSYCVKKNLLLAGEILLLSGLTDLADGYIARKFHIAADDNELHIFPDFSQHRADFQFKFFPQDPTFHPFFSVIPCCKYSIDFCFRH